MLMFWFLADLVFFLLVGSALWVQKNMMDDQPPTPHELKKKVVFLSSQETYTLKPRHAFFLCIPLTTSKKNNIFIFWLLSIRIIWQNVHIDLEVSIQAISLQTSCTVYVIDLNCFWFSIYARFELCSLNFKCLFLKTGRYFFPRQF